MRTERPFFQEFGADKSISSLSNFPTHRDGFIMIQCMSDLVEEEIQRFGVSLLLWWLC